MQEEADSGLFGSVNRFTATFTGIVSTRLELLANELQEERLRLTQLFIFILIALFCFGMCLLLFTVFIVVLFWDDHRLAVLGTLTVIFFALGSLVSMLLRGKAQEKSKLFSASLAELAKDREQLGAHHE